MDGARDFLIKICGVTSPEDAALAAGAGAGAIGVNFWPDSKRFVGDEQAARRVLAAIPPGVLKVGVFVNAEPAAVVGGGRRSGPRSGAAARRRRSRRFRRLSRASA